MKHAFLIIAHNEPKVLRVLLTMLDDPRNDIYVHVDRKSEKLYAEVMTIQLKHAGFYVLSDRIAVSWGNLTQVRTEYLLLQTARSNGPYSYYHLLSGVDLPIQTQDYIHDFYCRHQGLEFVDYWSDAANQRDLARKIAYYYFFTKYMHNKQHVLHGVTSLVRNLCLVVQKGLRLRRHRHTLFCKGSNWFSITQDCCDYLIQHKKMVLKLYRYTLCPDEIFVQTLLWSSKFKEKIYQYTNGDMGSVRKIDWKRGGPYVWTAREFDELCAAPELFARKFSSRDIDLIYKIQSNYTSPVTTN